MKQKKNCIRSFLGCFGILKSTFKVPQFAVYFHAAVPAHTNVDVNSSPLNLKGKIGSRFKVVTLVVLVVFSALHLHISYDLCHL